MLLYRMTVMNRILSNKMSSCFFVVIIFSAAFTVYITTTSARSSSAPHAISPFVLAFTPSVPELNSPRQKFKHNDKKKSNICLPSHAAATAATTTATTTTTTMTTMETQTKSRADIEAEYLLPNQTHLTQDTTKPFTTTLSTKGVTRVNNGLSISTAYKLQKFIDETLESSLEEVNTFQVPRTFRFANVLEKTNRWDLLLPFDDNDKNNNENDNKNCNNIMLEAMNELLGENGKIAPILEELVGEDAILYELACLISDPGSNCQEIHPDILFEANKERIPLITCFVSLQDIDSTMGPTVFLPNTITEEHHKCINDESLADEMLQSIPSNISTLNTGDCALYNPMVLHAGGGNVSNCRRRLFYFTFMNSNITDPSSELNPGSINPVLKQRNITLRDVQECLKTSL